MRHNVILLLAMVLLGCEPEPAAVPAPPAATRSAGESRPSADFKPYTQKVPGTDIRFEMIPIPGGTFTMGSPETEMGRKADEGPQFRVKVEPFYMGRFEV